jgi:hypothetical protein
MHDPLLSWLHHFWAGLYYCSTQLYSLLLLPTLLLLLSTHAQPLGSGGCSVTSGTTQAMHATTGEAQQYVTAFVQRCKEKPQ